MNSDMKTPSEWVDDGAPWPPDRETFIRWVALIQEDAVKCYTVDEAIDEADEAFRVMADKLRSDDDFVTLAGSADHLERIDSAREALQELVNLKRS